MEFEIGYIWLILGALFLVIQIFFYVRLIFFPFAIAYFAVAISAFFEAGVIIQVTIFCLIFFLFYFIVRPKLLRCFFQPQKKELHDVDYLVGSPGIISAEIGGADQHGQVIIDGEEWLAVSSDQKSIPEGTEIIVDKIEGIYLYVSRMDLSEFEVSLTDENT